MLFTNKKNVLHITGWVKKTNPGKDLFKTLEIKKLLFSDDRVEVTLTDPFKFNTKSKLKLFTFII